MKTILFSCDSVSYYYITVKIDGHWVKPHFIEHLGWYPIITLRLSEILNLLAIQRKWNRAHVLVMNLEFRSWNLKRYIFIQQSQKRIYCGMFWLTKRPIDSLTYFSSLTSSHELEIFFFMCFFRIKQCNSSFQSQNTRKTAPYKAIR